MPVRVCCVICGTRTHLAPLHQSVSQSVLHTSTRTHLAPLHTVVQVAYLCTRTRTSTGQRWCDDGTIRYAYHLYFQVRARIWHPYIRYRSSAFGNIGTGTYSYECSTRSSVIIAYCTFLVRNSSEIDCLAVLIYI